MKWISSFFESIYRVMRWLPVIWNDRDWDDAYFFKLLEFKLTGMKKDMEEGPGLYDYKSAEQIEYALKILRRINSCPYIDIAYMFHDKKWGEIKLRWEKIEGTNRGRLFIDRDNVITREDVRQESIEHKRCSKMENYLEQQDIDILFRYIAKHIRGWWT